MQDLEFQIGELRSGLALAERKVEKKEDALTKKIDDGAKELTTLEKQIAELSTSFAEPLRNKPELKTLFSELD